MMNRYEWVKKVSLSGNTYYVPEPTLPVINYAFLHTVFYLFTTEENAKSGESEGATGFVLATESELHNDLPYLYAVTNAHCIEYLEDMGAKEVFLRFNTKDNTTDIIAVPLDMWKKHPKGDDLAVLPLEPSSQWRLVFVTDNKLLAVEHLVKHNIGVGDETITIGRYVKHGGKQLNLPAARFGHISALPLEKIYQEDRDFPQESFLVETHSISGFSGSPVFIQIEPDSRKAQEPISETTTFLLGVDWGHFDFKGELIDPKSQKVIQRSLHCNARS
jgi:hypothetical protein